MEKTSHTRSERYSEKRRFVSVKRCRYHPSKCCHHPSCDIFDCRSGMVFACPLLPNRHGRFTRRKVVAVSA